jgi:hypothetical protein
MFQLHEQYLDLASGFHTIELRDERGNQHIVQIAIGADACPACGHLHPKDGLGDLDPKALVLEVAESLNKSHDEMRAYGDKHGIPIR